MWNINAQLNQLFSETAVKSFQYFTALGCKFSFQSRESALNAINSTFCDLRAPSLSITNGTVVCRAIDMLSRQVPRRDCCWFMFVAPFRPQICCLECFRQDLPLQVFVSTRMFLCSQFDLFGERSNKICFLKCSAQTTFSTVSLALWINYQHNS